jgi:hypothetical protein
VRERRERERGERERGERERERRERGIDRQIEREAATEREGEGD